MRGEVFVCECVRVRVRVGKGGSNRTDEHRHWPSAEVHDALIEMEGERQGMRGASEDEPERAFWRPVLARNRILAGQGSSGGQAC